MIKSLKPTELLKYICVYGIFSLLIVFRQLHYAAIFSLVYFLFIGLVVFLLEPVLNKNATAQAKLCFNVFVAMVLFGSTYEQFDNAGGQLNKMLSAAGSALFIAGLIAVTDKNKFNYCMLIIPIMFFLDKQLCICTSALFLAIFILNLFLDKKVKIRKSKKNKSENQNQLNIVYVVASLLGLIVSIILYVINAERHSNSWSYFLHFGLNCFTAIFVSIFILVKLIRNNPSFSLPLGLGLFILIGTSVFAAVYIGVVAFAVSVLSVLFFLFYCCLRSEDTFDSIIAEYNNHKLAFWITAVLLLV